jgi:hypothetical protein
MKQYPPIPRTEDAPAELFESGHLWLLEKIDGAQLRVQLRESGLLRFGDRTRAYDDPDSIPEPYQHAVRYVRNNLDREALRNAVEDVESVVLFGEATHRQTIDYEWDRLPSFLGFDVYSAANEGFLSPDAVESVFRRLDLDPINAFERERNTRDFDPDSYAVPDSAWYDGPAAGVIIKNKRGGRAKLLHPSFQGTAEFTPIEGSAEAVAETLATEKRFERLSGRLENRGTTVSFETLYDEVLTDIIRQEHGRLYHGASSLDLSAFRSELAARTRAFLG